ncbi:hypothetical protein R3P38DRAFT_517016 [Favolaschia claudopus]|uniref:DUF6534 domain-containing protein n=1 Tax=Favolaschia claudopus TaxID=2862362 RepID=A0AAV9ZBG3_9AGAR
MASHSFAPGPMLIGLFLSLMIYGSVVTQMVRYFVTYKRDSTFLKCLMTYLLVAQTATIVMQCGIIYQPLIVDSKTEAENGFTPKRESSETILSPGVYSDWNLVIPSEAILITLVATPIQLFSGWRISVITGSFLLPGIIALLSLSSCGSGINMAVLVFRHRRYTLGLSHALYTRKQGLLGGIDTHLNRIIRLTLETGSLTAFTALLDVILCTAIPLTSTNFIADLPLSGVYTWSMLAMLNSRPRTIDELDPPTQLRFSQAPSIFRIEQHSFAGTSRSSEADSEPPIRMTLNSKDRPKSEPHNAAAVP